jgi:hypothetical protein
MSTSLIHHVHLGTIYLRTKPHLYKSPSYKILAASHLNGTHLTTKMATQSLLLSQPSSAHSQPPTTTLHARPSEHPPFKSLSADDLSKLLKWLSLLPDRNDPAWQRRCFDCFQICHAPSACHGYVVCLKSLDHSHPTRNYPRCRRGGCDPRADASRNRGESLLLNTRPAIIHAFVHENPTITAEL